MKFDKLTTKCEEKNKITRLPLSRGFREKFIYKK